MAPCAGTIPPAQQDPAKVHGVMGTPVHVSDISWHAAEPYLTFDASSARQSAVKSLKLADVDPKCTEFNVKLDMVEGFENFVPVVEDAYSCTAISAWIAHSANAASPTITSVTGNANFIADSGILTSLAATPYASENAVGWEIGAFRCEQTVFLFDCRCVHPTDEAIQETFQLEKLRRVLTKEGYDKDKPLDANEAFHRLLSCELGSGTDALRILYTAPIDALTRKGDAVSVRIEWDEDEHDEEWYRRALGWYLESRFANAKEIYVGEVKQGKLVGMAQVLPEWIAQEAEITQSWYASDAYSFLHDVLKSIRAALNSYDDFQVVVAKFAADKRQVQFERRSELDDGIPVSDEFWRRFGNADEAVEPM
ncbi:dom-3 [Aphelenchoides avenae]|nr:dom-3 [Aphelenchus avenae]